MRVYGPLNVNFGGAVFYWLALLLGTPPFAVRSDQACYFRFKNLALNIRNSESLCLSDETLKSVLPFYLVSMPGEVKYPTQG